MPPPAINDTSGAASRTPAINATSSPVLMPTRARSITMSVAAPVFAARAAIVPADVSGASAPGR